MKKLFTLMAAVLLTFIGSMNVIAQEVREIPINEGWGTAWGDVEVTVSGGEVSGTVKSGYGAFKRDLGGPQDLSIFDKLCVELVSYNQWWGQIIIQTPNGDLAATVINMQMNGKTVTIPFDYSKATDVTAIAFQGDNSGNAIIKVKRIYLLEAEKDEPAWSNLLPNGDCERDYAEGELPSLTGKSGSGDKAGQMLHTFEEGKGVNGSRAMVIYGTDNKEVDSWNTQFFVTTPDHIWKAGDQYRFKMTAKADNSFEASTQIHKMPGEYIFWQGVGNFKLTSDWQSFETTGTISEAQTYNDNNGNPITDPQTIAFNLDLDHKAEPANTFYFDNVEWYFLNVWPSTSDFKDGKPVTAVDKSLTASWQVGDIVKVWTDGKKGTYPVMALTNASGESIYAGASYLNENYVKFGITEKMLPLLQGNGVNVLGTDVTMTKVVRLENDGAVSFDGACWIGDYTFGDVAGPFIQVPAYEFTGDVEAGYTIDMRFDGDPTLTDMTLTFGGSTSVSYAKNPEFFKVAGKSIKLKITDEQLPLLQKNGLEISAIIPEVSLRAIVITPTLGTNTFNFIKAKIATSNYGNDGDIIPENLDGADYLEIIDEVDGNGEAGSGAKLTITPNLDVDDFPAEVPAVTRFYMTEGGPQLRISGGYNGMTLKFAQGKEPIRQINFYQTNWSISTKADKGTFDPKNGVWKSGNVAGEAEVTFTIKADTTEVWKKDKLQEVILNDMGLMNIYDIDVNPVEDVIVNAENGVDIYSAVVAELSKMKNLPKSLTINLVAGGNYTTSGTIDIEYPLTINGNGATIDASALKAPFTKITSGSSITSLKEIKISGVNVTGLPYQFFYCNKVKCLVDKFSVDNCYIGVDGTNKKTVFDFNSSGNFAALSITNSTIFANPANEQAGSFISTQSAKKVVAELGGKTQSTTIKNSTIYNMSYNKNFCTQVQNNQSWMSFDVENNIFVNCGKKGQVLKALGGNASNLQTNASWTVANNVFNMDKEDCSSVEIIGSYTGAEDMKTIAKLVSFKDADKGDFTQTDVEVGDPRWLKGGSGKPAAEDGEATGIETVKNAQESGAWYTIQGVRVAQPTKGLYIHNGKKVILK